MSVVGAINMPIEAGRFVGQRINRNEDARLLSGRGQFVDDIVLPRMLHIAFVRSEVARGRIIDIDTAEAAALSGVVAVYTGADINPRVGPTWTDVSGPVQTELPSRALADGDVRYVGEPVAMVLASSRYVAEDAADLVRVEIEPMGPILDIDAALVAGNGLVHPELGTNIGGALDSTPDESFLALFDGARVVEQTFHQHRYLCVPMETRGLVVSWDPFVDEMSIWASTQSVHGLRSFASRLLGISDSKIRVIAKDVGGGFGQKMMLMAEEWAVLIAGHLIGQPVKWIEDRRENFLSGGHSREERLTLSAAVRDDGTIVAFRGDHVENVGAGATPGAVPMGTFSALMLPGPYRIDRSLYDARTVHTNTCGRCAYRGPWMMETTGREQLVDLIAVELDLDPLEVRRRNVIHQSDLPYTTASGMIYPSLSPSETLEQAAELIDYATFREQQVAARAEGRYLGIGLSLFVEPSGIAAGMHAADEATVRIEPSGKVFVFMGSTSHGHSLETTIVQIVAEELGLEMDDVRLIQGDSTAAPYGFGTGGSRSGPIGGTLAKMAAVQLRDKVLALASHFLEAAADDLVIQNGLIGVRGSPSVSISLSDLAWRAYGDNNSLPGDMEPGLSVSVRFKPPLFTFSNGCHACIVEVDIDTGVVRVLRYVVSEDCGHMINPNVVEGQIAGGVVQGLGGALLEHMIYDGDGNPLTTTFMDYLLPTAADVPLLQYGHIETPSETPGGFRGLGEGGAIAAPAAVMNAINDALSPFDVRLNRQPATPNAIVQLLADRRR